MNCDDNEIEAQIKIYWEKNNNNKETVWMSYFAKGVNRRYMYNTSMVNDLDDNPLIVTKLLKHSRKIDL